MPDLFYIATSPIQGNGGFARVDIPRGVRIAEYTGRRITKLESLAKCEENNPYIFALDDEFDLDGDVEANPARFFNHSCEANCEAENIGGRIWIIARRAIKAGEEITFNYGYDLESYREYPCRCGAPSCVGYIVAEEFFADLLKKRSQTLSET
jgi:SET domain-containing protein